VPRRSRTGFEYRSGQCHACPITARTCVLYDMTFTQTTRRAFLRSVGLAAVSLPAAGALTACVSSTERSLNALTRAEARTFRAFATQILPPVDGHAGADELGVVDFADGLLARPMYNDERTIVQRGLADLDARARALGAHAGFASLRGDQQIHIMHDVEATDFFAVARTLAITGAFAEPSYGGNRNAEGWTLIGIEHRASYAAPYGWYDAQPVNAAGAA